MINESALSPARPGSIDILERAREALGPARPAAWSGLGIILPDPPAPVLGPLFSGGVQHLWNLATDQIGATIQLMIAGDPWPHSLLPTAGLTLLHRFTWTGTGRPGDAPDSICITHLAARSALIPYFFFPFESADESFLSYLHHIRTRLPLPLSAKNFRLFLPTGRTGTLVPRRFDTSAIAAVLGR